jgi:guanylate kinase
VADIVVVSGPGGVGKGTVVARLVDENDRYWLSRSWTTRDRRVGEDPDAYVFVTRNEFEERIAAGGFVEYAEFLGNYYGTPTPDAPAGKILIYEIDVQGARQVAEIEPDALLVFLIAPSAEEQHARLIGRGDPPEKIQERVRKADEEKGAAAELGAHTIVNDQLDRTVAELDALILASFGGATNGRNV